MSGSAVAIIAIGMTAALLGAGVGVLGTLKWITDEIKSGFYVNDTAMYDSYVHWKNRHGKVYGAEEEMYRYKTYKSNSIFVFDHNKKYETKESSFFVSVNEFADLTNSEFKATHFGLIKKTSTKGDFLVSSVPASVDWRQKGAVSPIKNQGSCGSCWAFSAVGSLEGCNQIKNGKLVQFSEQQLVDCSKSYGNMGCNGGLMDYAFKYVIDHGITTEDKYPYKARDGSCQYTADMEAFRISSYKDVPQNSSSQLQAAIALGPVSVAIEADGLWFQFYRGGVFDHSCGTNLDHGVLAVGYGTDSGKDYFTVKNSWGSSWGESGYIRLANHGDGPGKCGIQMSASYPIA